MRLTNSNKSSVLFASAAFVSALGLPGVAMASDDEISLVMATESGDVESVQGKAITRISDLVSEKSDGRITIDVFYQDQLGGPQELFDQLVMGNVDLMLTWPHTSYDERLGVLHLPYLTLGWDDALNAYSKDGWLSEIVQPILGDMGLEYLGPFPEGFGGIATRGKYATNYEDAQGIKVRSAPIFPLPQTVEAMGYQAVPIDWSEVYTSIQTGVVDGDSSNVIYWDYTYFNDLLNYYVHTKHNFSFYAFLMNQNAWNNLDEEDQGIISNAVNAVVEDQFKNAKQEDSKWIQKAQEEGMEYIEPSQEEMNDLVQRVRKTVWNEAEDTIGKDIMDKVRAHASKPE